MYIHVYSPRQTVNGFLDRMVRGYTSPIAPRAYTPAFGQQVALLAKDLQHVGGLQIKKNMVGPQMQTI